MIVKQHFFINGPDSTTHPPTHTHTHTLTLTHTTQDLDADGSSTVSVKEFLGFGKPEECDEGGGTEGGWHGDGAVYGWEVELPFLFSGEIVSQALMISESTLSVRRERFRSKET